MNIKQRQLLTCFIPGYDKTNHVDPGHHLDIIPHFLLETVTTSCIVMCHGMFWHFWTRTFHQ